MTKPGLTAIIPNYNHAAYLGECLDAIFAQTRPADQVILIDDASTDNSVELIENYPHRSKIEFIRNERNLGVAGAFNKALAATQHEYVYMHGADDVTFPNFFADCMSLLESYPQTAICCTHAAYLLNSKLDLREDLERPSQKPCYLNPREVVAHLKSHRLWIPGHTSILKTQACRELGNYNPEYKWHADWFLINVLAMRTGLCFVPNPGAAMRLLETSYCHAGQEDRKAVAEIIWKIIQKLNTPEFGDVRDAFFESGVFENWPDFLHEIKPEPSHWTKWVSQAERIKPDSRVASALKRKAKKMIYKTVGSDGLSLVMRQYRRWTL